MDYEAAEHIYSDHGKVIPSVTTILSPTAAKPWFSHESAARGTLAHDRCAAWAAKAVAFPYEPYVDAFAMWCFKHAPEWVKLESIPIDLVRRDGITKALLKQFSVDGKVDGMRYAGRLDGLAMVEGKLTLIDWKTGVKAKYHHAQVGAYALVEKPARGLVLYLHDDMTYSEDWMSPTDLLAGIQQFRTALEDYYAAQN